MSLLERLWNVIIKSDGLIIVKLISSTIYQFYLMKFVLIIYLAIHIASQLFQIYLCIYELNLQDFIQYSALFFFNFCGIIAGIILLENPKIIENFLKDFNISIENATDRIRSKIYNEIKLTTFLVVTLTICMLILGLLIFFCESYDYKMYLLIKYFVDNYSAETSYILIKIYKSCFILEASLLTANVYQYLYISQHIRFQFWMLIDETNNIIELPKTDFHGRRLIDDSEYQKQIQLKLIQLIQRHQHVLNVTRQKINEVANYVPIYWICYALAILSAFCVILSGTFTTQYDYRFTPLACSAIVFGFFLTITAGQSIEDVTENLYDALQQVPWYYMDNENRKMFSNILMIAQRRVAIKFSDNYSINNALGLAIVRGAYSAVTVLLQYNNY